MSTKFPLIEKVIVAQTLCNDGTIISTVGFPGLNQLHGDYETVIFSNNWRISENLERYETFNEASLGHNKYVKLHNGELSLCKKILYSFFH